MNCEEIDDSYKFGRDTMIKDYIYTGKSTINHNEIDTFAAKTFKPEEKIGVYLGEVYDVYVSGDYVAKRSNK